MPISQNNIKLNINNIFWDLNILLQNFDIFENNIMGFVKNYDIYSEKYRSVHYFHYTTSQHIYF